MEPRDSQGCTAACRVPWEATEWTRTLTKDIFSPTKLSLGNLTTNDILNFYGMPSIYEYIMELTVRFAFILV